MAEDGQLALFADDGGAALPPLVPALPPLAEVPAPPLHRVRRLSFSALALFERCSYRYYAERVIGMRPTDMRAAVPGTSGLAATEIGDAVHRLLELVNLREPLPPEDLVTLVRGWYPRVTDEELERISGFVRSYCESELARRVATLDGARPERPFAFEHDGVLLRGRLDVLQLDGEHAVVVDYKTNTLEEGTPEEIVDADYRSAAAGVRARVLPRRRARGRGGLPLPRASGRRRVDALPARAGRRARGRSQCGDRAHQRGRVPSCAGRVHLQRLSRSRRRLRRPSPALA